MALAMPDGLSEVDDQATSLGTFELIGTAALSET